MRGVDAMLPEGVTFKALRLDPRDQETMDLATFGFVEIVRGHRRIKVRISDNPPRVCVSADDQLTINPVGSNWVDILL